MTVIDLPAEWAVVDHDFDNNVQILSTPDTSTFLTLNDRYDSIRIYNYAGDTPVLGWRAWPEELADVTVTDVRYVAITRLTSGVLVPNTWQDYGTRPEPQNVPFLGAVPTTGAPEYALEVSQEWAETVAGVAVGFASLPTRPLDHFYTRVAPGTTVDPVVDLAYLAIRVTYDVPVPPPPTSFEANMTADVGPVSQVFDRG